MVDYQDKASGETRQLVQTPLKSIIAPTSVHILSGCNKTQALTTLIDCLASAPQVGDREDLMKGIFHREQLMSTGIGMGIAVPHVRLSTIRDIVMCAALCRPPIVDYDSLDGLPVELIFMIAAGKDQHAKHLKLLSSISSRLKDHHYREALTNAADTDSFYNILTEDNG